MARRSAYASPGWAGAIGITVGLYLTVGICLGGAFYWLMQPKVIENAGVAAYRPPPGTALGYAPALVRSSGPPVVKAPVALEQHEPEVVAAKAPESQSTATKQQGAGKGQAATSTRARRPPQRRDPMRDFAYQPSFGFRPWF